MSRPQARVPAHPLLLLLLSAAFTGIFLPDSRSRLFAAPSCSLAPAGESGTSYPSLQSAIDDPACTTVDLAAGTYAERLIIKRSLTLQGAGQGQTIIDAGQIGRAVEIQSGASVQIAGVTIRGGRAGEGGGIRNAGSLTLSASSVVDNRRVYELDPPITGGGIFNTGILTISDTTISNNSANDSGAIYSSGPLSIDRSNIQGNTSLDGGVGGISASAALTLTRSAIVGNTGSGLSTFGASTPIVVENVTIGGNSLGGIVNAATLAIRFSTIIQNAGIANLQNTETGIASLNSTIMSDQTIFSKTKTPNCAGAPDTIRSQGHNIDSGATCGLSGPGDRSSINPLLLQLQESADSTPVYRLRDDSPAIDAGDSRICPASDQRARLRPQASRIGALAICDSGAYEYLPNSTITRISPPTVNAGYPAFTLRVDGLGFVPESSVQLNGYDLPTTYISSTRLLASIDQFRTSQPVSHSVTIVLSGTDDSNFVPLIIKDLGRKPSLVEPLGGAGGGGSTVIVSGTLAYVGIGGQLAILDLANPAVPRLLGSYTTPEIVQAIAVEGSRAYVANELGGLLIFDVADPTAPRLLSHYQTPGEAYDLRVRDGVAYVTLGYRGLQMINVSDPEHPQLLGHYQGTNAYALDLVGNIAYITAIYDSPVIAIDISNPHKPIRAGGLSYGVNFFSAYDVQIVGDIGYAASGSDGLVLFRLNDKGIPDYTLAGHQSIPGGARALSIANGRAYVSSASGSLHIFDLSNPLNSQPLGSLKLPSMANDLRVVGDLAYVADGAGGLRVLNVANPAAVAPIGAFETWAGQAIELDGSRAYIAAGTDGTHIIDLSEPLRPRRLGSIPALSQATQTQRIGDRLYIANQNIIDRSTGYVGIGGGLQIADISDPTSPTLRSNFLLTDTLRFQVTGRLAYIASTSGLKIVNIENPDAPQLLQTFTTTQLMRFYDIQIIGTRAYVLADGSDGYVVLAALDLSNPISPTVLGSVRCYDNARRLLIDGARTYLFRPNSSDIEIVDISETTTLRRIGLISGTDVLYTFYDIQVRGNLLYASASGTNQGYLYIYDLRDPTAPQLLIEHEQSAYARGLALRDNLVYSASEDGGLQALRPRFDLVSTSAVITPDGGNLVNYSGNIALDFPAGALTSPITLTYSGLMTASQPLDAGSDWLRSFLLEARDSRGAPVVSFAAPYTLTIDYSEAELAAQGLDEAKLNLFFWDGKAWVALLPCAGCGVDTAANRLTVRVDHLTEFALGTHAAEPPPQPARRGTYLPLLGV